MQKPQPATSHANARILLCFKESQFQNRYFPGQEIAQSATQERCRYIIRVGNSRDHTLSFSFSEIYGHVNKRRVKTILLLDKGCASVLSVSGLLS